MDPEIKKCIIEHYLGEKLIDHTENNKADCIKQDSKFWYYLGYDYVRISGGIKFLGKGRETEDTAILSKGKRNWVEENTGMITNWEDFEKYPWQKKQQINYSSYEIASKKLPDGMKILACPSSGVFEIASEVLLGFENMSDLIADNYELVQAVFDKTGEIIYEFYKNVIEIDNVEGFFQGDDLGFKTSYISFPLLSEKTGCSMA